MELLLVTIFLVAIIGRVRGDSSSNACAELHNIFKAQVSFPNSTTYTQESFGSTAYPDAGYWSTQEAELSPTCRIAPTCAVDVTKMVEILTSHQAQFAVRSGGHLQNTGAANINDGITIDLSQLNFIDVGNINGIPVVNLGPRATWNEVYNNLTPRGLGVAGARVGGVGVGGFLTGGEYLFVAEVDIRTDSSTSGGLSYYSARGGLGCDNVIQYEVVLGDGSIAIASATQNHDLWIALKGGNNNFGIVTKFVVQTIKTGSIWGGVMTYAYSTADQQIEALYAFGENAGAGEDDASNIMQFFVNHPSTNTQIVVNNLANSAGVSDPPILHSFISLITPVLSDTRRQTNMSDLVNEVAVSLPNGHRELMAEVTFRNSIPMMKAAKALFDESFTPFAYVKGLTAYLDFQPIHTRIYEQSVRKGGNSLGLLPESGNLIWCLLLVTWDDSAADDAIASTLQNMSSTLEQTAVQLGVHNPYVYLNYALSTQDPIASYNATNQANLRAASLKYDPLQVFQKLVPGGFKLWPH